MAEPPSPKVHNRFVMGGPPPTELSEKNILGQEAFEKVKLALQLGIQVTLTLLQKVEVHESFVSIVRQTK